MFRFLKKIFAGPDVEKGKDSPETSRDDILVDDSSVEQYAEIINTENQSKDEYFEKVRKIGNDEKFFLKELKDNPHFKPEALTSLLKHFLGENNLFKTEPIPLEQKQALGLNTRAKYPKGVIDVATPEGLAFGPCLSIERIENKYRASLNLKYAMKEIRKSKDIYLGIEFMHNRDDRTCQWCKKMNGKILPMETRAPDIWKMIDENCECIEGYGRGGIIGSLKAPKSKKGQ